MRRLLSNCRKSLSGLSDNFLQSAARIICPLVAAKFHTCSLRSIFAQVHAPVKNSIRLYLRLAAQTLRGFLHTGIGLCFIAQAYFSIIMETLPNGYTLDVAEGCFPLSTDSMVLSHFVRLPRKARVLDLGSGCGTLGLLLCARDPSCSVTGMERDSTAHQAALCNIARNDLAGRMESICADLRQHSEFLSPGSYSCCISNPPYFSGGPGSRVLTAARREDQCTLADLCKAAAWGLKYGGDFFLVHRPERLAEIIAQGSKCGLEAKRLLLLRHRENGPITLVFLQLRKGGRPGLAIEEQALFTIDGTDTSFYRDVYHITDE